MGPWEGPVRFLALVLETDTADPVGCSVLADFLVADSYLDCFAVVEVAPEVHTVGSLGLCHSRC